MATCHVNFDLHHNALYERTRVMPFHLSLCTVHKSLGQLISLPHVNLSPKPCFFFSILIFHYWGEKNAQLVKHQLTSSQFCVFDIFVDLYLLPMTYYSQFMKFSIQLPCKCAKQVVKHKEFPLQMSTCT